MNGINFNQSISTSLRSIHGHEQEIARQLERLSTGKQINHAKDNPAGLIAANALKADLALTESKIDNLQRRGRILETADGALAEIEMLLTELNGLIVEAANIAGLSEDERQANQQQVNSILDAIERITQTTSFNGSKLLDGSLDFVIKGIRSDLVDDAQVRMSRQLHATSPVPIHVTVTQSAHPAGLFLSFGDAQLELADPDELFSVELGGSKGSQRYSFGPGTPLSNIAGSITQSRDQTGLTASAAGSVIEVHGKDANPNEFVSVKMIATAGQTGGVVRHQVNNAHAPDPTSHIAFGDAGGTVVAKAQSVDGLINASPASGAGTTLSVNNDQINASVTLTQQAAQQTGKTIELAASGGAHFDDVSLGIPKVTAIAHEGQTLNELRPPGAANLTDGDHQLAQQIAGQVASQVALERGRLGAEVRYGVHAMSRVLGTQVINTKAALSQIEDTDYAEATAQLTRSTLLLNTAYASLQIANEQRTRILDLLDDSLVSSHRSTGATGKDLVPRPAQSAQSAAPA